MLMRHLSRKVEKGPGYTSLGVQAIWAGKRNVGIHMAFKALRMNEMI